MRRERGFAAPEAGTALEWAPQAGPGGTQRRIRGRVVSIPLITPPYRVQFRGYWTAVPGLLSVGELSGLGVQQRGADPGVRQGLLSSQPIHAGAFRGRGPHAVPAQPGGELGQPMGQRAELAGGGPG